MGQQTWQHDEGHECYLPLTYLSCPEGFLSRQVPLCAQNVCVYTFRASPALRFCLGKKEEDREGSLISNSAGLRIPQKGNLT